MQSVEGEAYYIYLSSTLVFNFAYAAINDDQIDLPLKYYIAQHVMQLMQNGHSASTHLPPLNGAGWASCMILSCAI